MSNSKIIFDSMHEEYIVKLKHEINNGSNQDIEAYFFQILQQNTIPHPSLEIRKYNLSLSGTTIFYISEPPKQQAN